MTIIALKQAYVCIKKYLLLARSVAVRGTLESELCCTDGYATEIKGGVEGGKMLH
jgi:hypothetical protein